MEAFKVMIGSTAEADLRGILRYIAEALKAPEAAKRIYRSVSPSPRI